MKISTNDFKKIVPITRELQIVLYQFIFYSIENDL